MNIVRNQNAEFYASTRVIRQLIWVYFALLILEGALRKWVLPGLANPLLIVRDPVVILIYMLCFSRGVFPEDGFVKWMVGLGIASFLVSLVSGSGNLLVSIYGWRTDFLHLPLIFVMCKLLRPSDVRRICIALLISAIPMALLVLAQFKGGPHAWVNVGVGGSEGSQLDVGFGKIRPPGTFSFTNGLANYITLVVACLLYAVIEKKYYPRLVLLAAVPSALLMMVASASRAAVSASVISVLFLVLICLRRPSYIGGSFKFILLALPGLWLVGQMSVFQEGMMVHTTRFGATGGGIQHGIIQRALGDYIDGFRAIPDTPLLGNGLGLGTNAAAGMLGGGQRTFLLAEGEWARVVKEGGPIFGLGFLLLRTALALYIALVGFGALERKKPLCLLIFSACFLLVLAGQFGQPTALGFAVFGAGLALAAANDEPTKGTEIETAPVVSNQRVMRGRSVHAEALHRG